MSDPYADKKKPWGLYLFLLVLLALIVSGLCWYFGSMDNKLPKRWQSVTVLGTNAPAYEAPTNAPPPTVNVTNAAPAK
jgi:hypothetical protein